MVDLHSHILPGLDDGARSLEESVEIALTAARDGTTIMAATPHVRDDYPTAAKRMEQLVFELQRALRYRNVDLRVVGGAEIAIPRLRMLSDQELRRFGLGGNPRYLLIEFPYLGWPLSLESEIWNLRRRGFITVLAHPERNPEVQRAPKSVEPLVAAGALVQLTAASVDGRLGRRNKRAAFELISAGHAHLIASDAHWPGLREAGTTTAAQSMHDPELANWLVYEVPMAIVQDTAIPERPETRSGHFRRRRRR
ncbi:MAG: CpsB/CapC family capsule biosynthesis tyrosine phosphatase [Gaiellaceae bacterium]|jgi:protein-tyrosine phosphatase